VRTAGLPYAQEEEKTMIGKLASYGLVGMLAAVLIGGSAYILLRPEAGRTAQSERAPDGSAGNPSEQGAGNGHGDAFSGHAEAQSGEPFAQAGNGPGSKKGYGATEDEFQRASGQLSADEISGVRSLLEEEKLARDVYLALYRNWGYEAFHKISESEQSHMDALIGVLEQAGVSDPTAGFGPGEFATGAVQDLYMGFTGQGGQSLAAALRAGAAIEELDIRDIQRLQSGIDNPGLLRVLENLRQGSIRHLRAFRSAYERETGGAYVPQYLSSEDFNGLMSGAEPGNRNGQGGNGKGSGGLQT
jgi:hypothetical protein